MTATIPAEQESTIRSRFLDRRAASVTPTVFCMAGIPAAGKSTYVAAAVVRGEFPADAFVLNPDRVMESLPAYHADCGVLGTESAFHKWEMPCRDLAYAMLDDAASARLNIIKDMGCARRENYDMLARLKSSGYRLHMVYLECDTDTTIRRTQARERHTPPDMVRGRAESLAALLPLYRDLADEFRIVPFRPAP